jgi:deoxyribonuclease IV
VEHYFGAHTVDNGGIHMAARRAANAGMRALQIFTAIPKYYNDKVSIRPERVVRFR